ncbi:hypothetical protein Hanom_Chr17g01576151 [Helianthus anomalus]
MMHFRFVPGLNLGSLVGVRVGIGFEFWFSGSGQRISVRSTGQQLSHTRSDGSDTGAGLVSG